MTPLVDLIAAHGVRADRQSKPWAIVRALVTGEACFCISAPPLTASVVAISSVPAGIIFQPKNREFQHAND